MRRLDSSGQTLIALLIFMMLAIAITTAAAAITAVNARANDAYATGELALGDAETGAENALIQLERNPNYTGETMTLTNGTATITVSGTTTKTITAVGTDGSLVRTVTVTATYSGNVFTLASWSETP